MLLEVKGQCQACGQNYKIIITKDFLSQNCNECGESPNKIKLFKGLIYVVKNPNQTGVKVGLTTKSIEDRLKSLNSTGVPGKFAVQVIFPSDRPKEDEKKAHDKLQRHRLDKEHFDLNPLEAALNIYTALNRRLPLFYNNILRKEFDEELGRRRREMERRLNGN